MSEAGKRLGGLEGIDKKPSLIFTVDGGQNPKSEAIVDGLAEILRGGFSMQCRVFSDNEAADVYRREYCLNPTDAVAIFDGHLFGRKCMIPFRHEDAERYKVVLPPWAFAYWNVRVSSVVPDKRIASIIRQIFADFQKNYLARLDAGQFPWGNAPCFSVRALRKRNRKQMRLEKQRGLRLRGDDCGSLVSLW